MTMIIIIIIAIATIYFCSGISIIVINLITSYSIATSNIVIIDVSYKNIIYSIKFYITNMYLEIRLNKLKIQLFFFQITF